MENYKEDIINTRKGCLGGSDAKMLKSIALSGAVPKNAYRRLAICKGLIDMPNDIQTKEMRFGDFIEQTIFAHLHESDSRWQSNPCLVSKKYSRPNVKCIDHVDLYLEDSDKGIITIGEVKASKYPTKEVAEIYRAQLEHHYLLANEIAKGKGYDVRVILCHYTTEGLDLDDTFTFDTSRLTTVKVEFGKEHKPYNLSKAMDIVNTFLESFTHYEEDDEIDSELLPASVKQEFDEITVMLNEIREREAKVNEFKEKLCIFMQEKGIKSVKNDLWSITLINATESTSFDAKAFLKDYAAKHPVKHRKLLETFSKNIKRDAYVKITLK